MKKILPALLGLLFSAFGTNAQWVAQPSNVTAGYDVQFIDAVDQDVCWGLAADPLNQQNPVQEYTRTTNGGLSWVSGPITNTPGRCPSSIFALNADTAWVAMFSCTGGPGTGAIMRTNDGGLSWNQQTTALFSAAGNFPNLVYFWDANLGMCMGDPVDGFFEIYTTSDGGTNWSRTAQVEIPAQQANEFGITDVFTADHGSTLWFGTNLGRIYKTIDGGHTWTVAQTPFTDYIGAVAFRDALNGLCVSGGTIGSPDVARTTDGGASWALVGTNTAGMTLKGGLCFLPGSDSTYFISTPYAGSIDGTTFSPNDGNAWIPVDNLIHTDIEFVNDSTGWTGSNEQSPTNALMYKWSTPIVMALDDVGGQSIGVPASAGLTSQIPQATFINNGLNVQSFNVTMEISGGYTSTKTVTNLPFYNTILVDFDPWLPAASGPYTIKTYSSLGIDSEHNNDTVTKNVTVYEVFPNCGWVSKPAVPSPSFGAGNAFQLDGFTSSSPGRMFSIGGTILGSPLLTNDIYSTATSQWTSGSQMPSAKLHFSAQTVNGKVICAGGFSMGFTPDPVTYIYDIANDLWTTGASMPMAVGDYACGIYKDSLIYYVNGFDGGGDANIVQIYDVYNDVWSNGTLSPMGATEGTRGAINGNKFVIVGGFSVGAGGAIADAYVGDIDVVNPGNITWTAIAPYPAGKIFRPAAGAPFMDLLPIVLFAGGDPVVVTGQDKIGECWGYDLSLNSWFIGPEKITPVNNLMNFRGLIVNDTLWMAAVAGFDGTNPTTVNEWLCLGPQLWTGIDKQLSTEQKQLILYPNPSSTMLNVKHDHTIRVLEVYNVLGEMVLSEDISNSGGSVSILDISNLKPGVYSVRAIGEMVSNSTFVKE